MDWEKAEEALRLLKNEVAALEKNIQERDDIMGPITVEEAQDVLKGIAAALNEED